MKKQQATSKKPARKKQPRARAFSRPADSAGVIAWRYYAVCVLCLLLLAALVAHVASIQVLPAQDKGFEFLQGEGQRRFLRKQPLLAQRGIVTDRYGQPLAVSTPMITLCASPALLVEAKEKWPALAQALGLKASQVNRLLSESADKNFVFLKKDVPPDLAKAVLDLKLPGVWAEQDFRRFYPQGEVASHLVGLVKKDTGVGQEGVELAYEAQLAGAVGTKEVVQNLWGETVAEVRTVAAPQHGKPITLSIDLRLQYMAYRELKKAVQQHKAASGSVVILDTHTGEILAMVNQPSYNPNNRREITGDNLRNRAVTDYFEPGSTMKPLTVLAALESGRYTPGTIIDTNPGYYRAGKKVWLDPVNYKAIDLTTVIQKSSQVGISKIAMDLDPQVVRAAFYRMGLGQSTGLGFPGEAVGVLPNRQKWHDTERITFAFGYGMTTTALQLAQAYSVIANQGLKRPVSLLKLSEEDVKNQFTEQVADAKAARQVLAMMKTVLEPGGTGTNAKLASYSAAGKTGTAEVHAEGGGYSVDARNAIFAGIAPVEKPRIAVSVLISQPSDGLYYGGEVAAPVFAQVAENALRLLSTPPTELSSHQLAGKLKAGEFAL